MKTQVSYKTLGGASVVRQTFNLKYGAPYMYDLAIKLDTALGLILSSGYEYPGRYSRWDIGFRHPPIEIIGKGRKFEINALNERGQVLLNLCYERLYSESYIKGTLVRTRTSISGEVKESVGNFSEEERLRQPTIFSMLRSLVDLFRSPEDKFLGFYGAFGYDLVFQFEPIELRHNRNNDSVIHLFIPDELIVTDHRLEQTHRYRYDFESAGQTTVGLRRTGKKFAFKKGVASVRVSDHKRGEYEDKVRKVIGMCEEGEAFEVVLSQSLSAGYSGTPSELFSLIKKMNPSPYEFLINLGNEQLVGASPEMFVEVTGRMVCTCPICGTRKRGRTAYEDEINTRRLFNSKKDLYELNMATDVDRNDKSRVCIPGSVQLKGRRLIEKYSRLIHTVDHVVGELQEDKDGIDALISHMWAGTLIGAPKLVAMQTIENMENSARHWYGGCVGALLFNGDIKTGITIRTVHLRDGVATVRAGATLLAYSKPRSEEKETQLKASAFMDAVLGKVSKPKSEIDAGVRSVARRKILIVDNEDSFVHTLGNYVRQTGAETVTYRAGKDGISLDLLDTIRPDLVLISPGPGIPESFGVPKLVMACADRQIPVFGVCLGLQGIVEAFGGKLSVLDVPKHGVDSKVKVTQAGQNCGWLPDHDFMVGRYHSLYVKADDLPDCLNVLAHSKDGVIMAIAHKNLPIAAVQFHPESIMTEGANNVGLHIIASVIAKLTD